MLILIALNYSASMISAVCKVSIWKLFLNLESHRISGWTAWTGHRPIVKPQTRYDNTIQHRKAGTYVHVQTEIWLAIHVNSDRTRLWLRGHLESLMGSLIVCYANSGTINFPGSLPYSKRMSQALPKKVTCIFDTVIRFSHFKDLEKLVRT
jgi:hypothetical protein